MAQKKEQDHLPTLLEILAKIKEEKDKEKETKRIMNLDI